MNNGLRTALSYDRVVIAVLCLCAIALYIMALSARPAAAFSPFPFAQITSTGGEDGDDPALGDRSAKPVSMLLVNSADRLADVFDRLGYRLEGVRRHGQVPRLFLASLPKDFPAIKMPGHRKIVFIKSALPLILRANELIQGERKRIALLRGLFDRGTEIDPDDDAWLRTIAARYGLDRVDFEELSSRVDVIPPSLAIAQGAEESGWGTSRFVHEGNALFGQRIFKGKNGIVPKRRETGQRHKVRVFDQLLDGVRAYAHNLNTHYAYEDFRRAREKARLALAPLDGNALVGTLAQYSERRQDYVLSIRAIIRVNKLGVFDRARLGGASAAAADGPNA